MLCQLPLLSGGFSTGRVEYEELGLRVRFRCHIKECGLCKLYIVSSRNRLLLGTPEPAGEGLFLERTLSRSELERGGVWPPERVEAVGMARREVWQEVTPWAPVFGDPVLGRSFRQGGWCWRGWAKGVVLCCGWQENSPIPAMSVFCFFRLEQSRIMCWLKEDGTPCFPPE